MKTRTLGKDLTVSAVGFGCMGMTHAYGAPSDVSEMTRRLEEAVDLGYTFFDTAECYTGTWADGSTAYNEELVGSALQPYRDKVLIATKFGIKLEGWVLDSRPETIRRSLEGSLKKLRTDYVDLYYQHRIDPTIPIEEVAGTMSELIREGKIRHWGISEVQEDNLRRAHAVCPVTAIQNRYSMMSRRDDSLFPVLEELNIGYVSYSPLANGILSDKYDKNSKFEPEVDYRSFMSQFKPEAFDRNCALFELLRTMAAEKDATPAQISLAWMMCKYPNIVPIPGSRKADRIRENAGAADVTLTADEIRRIDAKLDEMGF